MTTETKKHVERTIPITVRVPITKLTMEIYQNFPEASFSLQCTGWRYGDEHSKGLFRFKFYDAEEDKTHTIGIAKAEKGVARLIELWSMDKLHFCGISDIGDLLDTCNWDATVCDAAVQCAIFNEVIYG